MTTGRTRARLATLAASLIAAAVLAACGDDASRPVPAGPADAGDAGAQHIHGLGVNPADGALFIATHTGLFRAAPGAQAAERVGDRHQDTMGFTVVGPDEFLGSGHPDAREDLPPLLGLIRSDDAGKSWEPVSLLGEADFHVLRTAGTRIFGVNATDGLLMVSDDGGRTWAKRTPPGALLDVVADPADPDRFVAAGEDGLHVSSDAGERWRPLGGSPGLLAWTEDGLFSVDAAGAVSVSSDAGRSWRAAGQIGGQPAAFAADGGDLYVALHTNEVKVSRDGGRTWQVRVAAS